MFDHEIFMNRCFNLARLGSGKVSPNPMVGAVLVYQGQIIGEGYHRQYGKAHAEVNAIASVPESIRHLISQSTLYVSLEPCCIHGNTPPCTDLIIRHKIPHVVIAGLDQTPGVAGKGVAILREAGIQVTIGVLGAAGELLNWPRNVFVSKHRPYIILKMAQTPSGFMAGAERQSVSITNSLTQRLVHRWRSEADAILVGTNTALIDNPQLTNRYYYGKSPVRIVLDRHGKLPTDAKLLDGGAPTIVVTQLVNYLRKESVEYLHTENWEEAIPKLLSYLFEKKMAILFVEGGPKLLRYFIEKNLWEEARVLVGQRYLSEGLQAPTLPHPPVESMEIGGDTLFWHLNR